MQNLTINQNDFATSNIPIIWNDVFEGLLSYRLPLQRLPRKPDHEELMFKLYQKYTLHIGLHWAIKKEWNTKHKIPAGRSVTKRMFQKRYRVRFYANRLTMRRIIAR